MTYENQGVVEVIESREFDGKRGPVTLWSFQIEGSRRWFRLGRVEPEFQEGDNIGFENDEKGNVDVDTIVFDPEPKRTARGSGGGRSGDRSRGRSGGSRNAAGGGRTRSQGGGSAEAGGVTRDGYWANKEARDLEREKRYQEVDVPRMSLPSAREAAIKVTELALANGAVSLGTKKAAEKLDTLVGIVDELTDKFFADNMNAHNRLKEAATGERAPAFDPDEEEFEDDEE